MSQAEAATNKRKSKKASGDGDAEESVDRVEEDALAGEVGEDFYPFCEVGEILPETMSAKLIMFYRTSTLRSTLVDKVKLTAIQWLKLALSEPLVEDDKVASKTAKRLIPQIADSIERNELRFAWALNNGNVLSLRNDWLHVNDTIYAGNTKMALSRVKISDELKADEMYKGKWFSSITGWVQHEMWECRFREMVANCDTREKKEEKTAQIARWYARDLPKEKATEYQNSEGAEYKKTLVTGLLFSTEIGPLDVMEGDSDDGRGDEQQLFGPTPETLKAWTKVHQTNPNFAKPTKKKVVTPKAKKTPSPKAKKTAVATTEEDVIIIDGDDNAHPVRSVAKKRSTPSSSSSTAQRRSRSTAAEESDGDDESYEANDEESVDNGTKKAPAKRQRRTAKASSKTTKSRDSELIDVIAPVWAPKRPSQSASETPRKTAAKARPSRLSVVAEPAVVDLDEMLSEYPEGFFDKYATRARADDEDAAEETAEDEKKTSEEMMEDEKKTSEETVDDKETAEKAYGETSNHDSEADLSSSTSSLSSQLNEIPDDFDEETFLAKIDANLRGSIDNSIPADSIALLDADDNKFHAELQSLNRDGSLKVDVSISEFDPEALGGCVEILQMQSELFASPSKLELRLRAIEPDVAGQVVDSELDREKFASIVMQVLYQGVNTGSLAALRLPVKWTKLDREAVIYGMSHFNIDRRAAEKFLLDSAAAF